MVPMHSTRVSNIKTFPLVIRYFDWKEDVCTKLLAFYNLESEASSEIAASIIIWQELKRANLNLKNIAAYSADNATVNFGKHQSVFTEFKKDNKDIMAMVCVNHILHNTAKKDELHYVSIKSRSSYYISYHVYFWLKI